MCTEMALTVGVCMQMQTMMCVMLVWCLPAIHVSCGCLQMGDLHSLRLCLEDPREVQQARAAALEAAAEQKPDAAAGPADEAGPSGAASGGGQQQQGGGGVAGGLEEQMSGHMATYYR